MGTFSLPIKIGTLGNSRRRQIRLIVDTGAHLSVVPKKLLKSLKVRPRWRRAFILANGERIERDVGVAVFQHDGVEGASEVVFGEVQDKGLLGALTLEALGLKVDPRKRTVEHQELLLLHFL